MMKKNFLGLRKKEGVNMAAFTEKFGQDFETIYGEVVALQMSKHLFI